jgi:hypothetical protein
LDETDVANMAAWIRKDDGMMNLSFIVEKNLKLAVAEARTRKETSQPLTSFHTADATKLPLWMQTERKGILEGPYGEPS